MKHRTAAITALAALALAGCTTTPEAHTATAAPQPEPTATSSTECDLMRAAGRPNDDLTAGHEAARTLRNDYTQQDLLDAVATTCPDLADIPPLVVGSEAALEDAARKEAERDAAVARAICATVADPTPAAIAQWEAGWLDVRVTLPSYSVEVSESAPAVRRIVAEHCPDADLERLG